MLISRKHHFVFIHIYKNAGTSITEALLPFAAGQWNRRINAIINRFGVLYPLGPNPYHGHIKASELVEKMGRGTFSSYFSFAIVRNPWDRQVSLYTYMLKNTRHRQHELIKSLQSFDRYIEWVCAQDVTYQKDFVTSATGEQLVDFIGKYENLDADFGQICSRIGISATLPKLNISKARPYQDYYSQKTIDLVRGKFEPDISLFDYEFEPMTSIVD